MNMYARIGTFKITPSKLGALVDLFRESAARSFSKHEGFLEYQSYTDAEAGVMVGISRWISRAALESSVDTARQLLQQAAALGATVVGEPTILEQAFDEGPIFAQT